MQRLQIQIDKKMHYKKSLLFPMNKTMIILQDENTLFKSVAYKVMIIVLYIIL